MIFVGIRLQRLCGYFKSIENVVIVYGLIVLNGEEDRWSGQDRIPTRIVGTRLPTYELSYQLCAESLFI